MSATETETQPVSPWDHVLSQKYDNVKEVTEVGEVVTRKNGQPLRSGAEAYGFAIVVSVEPFVLVSQGTDMRWSATVMKDGFYAHGLANQDLVDRCKRRL